MWVPVRYFLTPIQSVLGGLSKRSAEQYELGRAFMALSYAHFVAAVHYSSAILMQGWIFGRKENFGQAPKKRRLSDTKTFFS